MKKKFIIFTFLIIIIILLINYIPNRIMKQKELEEKNKLEINLNKLNKLNLNKLSDLYDIPTYYINLDRSKDRFNKINDVITKYNLKNIKRISGVDGKKIYNKLFSIKSSEIGCTLSHLKAIKQAYDNNDDYALILEDDALLETLSVSEQSLTSLIKKDNDFGILQLFNIHEPKIVNLNHKNVLFSHTLAYIISKKGMGVFLNYFKYIEKLNYKYHDKNFVTDLFIYEKVLKKKLKILYYGNKIYPGNFDSVIGNGNLGKFKLTNDLLKKIK